MKCDKRQINGTQERQNGTQNKLYTKVETKKVTHYKKNRTQANLDNEVETKIGHKTEKLYTGVETNMGRQPN